MRDIAKRIVFLNLQTWAYYPFMICDLYLQPLGGIFEKIALFVMRAMDRWGSDHKPIILKRKER